MRSEIEAEATASPSGADDTALPQAATVAEDAIRPLSEPPEPPSQEAGPSPVAGDDLNPPRSETDELVIKAAVSAALEARRGAEAALEVLHEQAQRVLEAISEAEERAAAAWAAAEARERSAVDRDTEREALLLEVAEAGRVRIEAEQRALDAADAVAAALEARLAAEETAARLAEDRLEAESLIGHHVDIAEKAARERAESELRATRLALALEETRAALAQGVLGARPLPADPVDTRLASGTEAAPADPPAADHPAAPDASHTPTESVRGHHRPSLSATAAPSRDEAESLLVGNTRPGLAPDLTFDAFGSSEDWSATSGIGRGSSTTSFERSRRGTGAFGEVTKLRRPFDPVRALLLLSALLGFSTFTYYAVTDDMLKAGPIATMIVAVASLVLWTQLWLGRSRLWIEGDVLHVVARGSHRTVDLASEHLRIETDGRVGARNWRMHLQRRGRSRITIDPTMVSPRALIAEVRDRRP
ncbi:hypothetical protein K8Z61_09345 [Nocardioides sp. TRM66260-LWL]|uniref:hypothetical protein n=1 Tax=Nocardioides sp. TRM66260-LWL TaxID=2874478 RepID=UPI001CC54F86|nr:hypothetical protein [Nocardioides sp. TRM66260-LWL]MBZ5734699.1 hypothetical protein [Nocardioides sp. TRM66260-LWL]